MKKQKVKTVEEIERKIENQIEHVFDMVDDLDEKRKNKIIKVDIERKFDLIQKYSDKKVSTDLIEFLINQISLYKNHEKVIIRLNKKCELDVNAIKLIKDGLKEEYNKSIELRDTNNLKQLWLLTMGIFFLFISTKIPDDMFLKEVFVITGWVPIWEMIEVELFPDAEERKRRKSIKRLLKCPIVERTVVNENVERIEVSKLEDVI